MRDSDKGTWQETRRINLGSVLVLWSLAITGSKGQAVAAESGTQANDQRIHRTIEHGDEVIEQGPFFGHATNGFSND